MNAPVMNVRAFGLAPEAAAPYEPKFVAPKANPDIVLLSSTGVRFEAHQTYLAAASVLLETMLLDVRQPEAEGLPEVQMSESTFLLDCLLCHSYASLTWSFDGQDFDTLIEIMACADKFAHPRLMASSAQALISLIAGMELRRQTLSRKGALEALTLGHRYGQKGLVDTALPHCGHWEDLENVDRLDPVLGFEGLKGLITSFRMNRQKNIRLFDEAERKLLQDAKYDIGAFDRDTEEAEGDLYGEKPYPVFDWSRYGTPLAQVWKAARDVLQYDSLPYL